MSESNSITAGDNVNAPVGERLQNLIENLSSYIEFYHGGWVKLVSFDGQVARVELGGACEGCPLSLNTLHGWIAGTLRQFFPDIVVEEVRP
ncbi:MAG TPA: NifU family protein [Aggregatilineaceae bacterium]|nr:NifU family protein [Aggregatilineaceae bacterium]